MLYVALSCLQGRPMIAAFDELARLGTGIQLTPGNLPDRGFQAHVAASPTVGRRHHGFAWRARKTEPCRRVGIGASTARRRARRLARAVRTRDATPDPRGDVSGLRARRRRRGRTRDGRSLVLAIDISHVFLQIAQGAMHDRTWRRLQTYEHLAEVHISANQGRADSHRPLTTETFGLAWARERVADPAPVVLECYMHKLSEQQRHDQLGLVMYA